MYRDKRKIEQSGVQTEEQALSARNKQLKSKVQELEVEMKSLKKLALKTFPKLSSVIEKNSDQVSSDTTQKVWKCDLCDMSFLNQAIFDQHINLVHSTK